MDDAVRRRMNATNDALLEMLLYHRVQGFLAEEANLLDAGEFEKWHALFADNGVYWIPSSAAQDDMHSQVSIVLEDKALLGVRIARLGHPQAYSLEPRPHTLHLIGNVRVLESANGQDEINVVKSGLVMTMFRDERLVELAAHVTHHLRPNGDTFEIVLKRVDLLQCGGALPVITVPL